MEVTVIGRKVTVTDALNDYAVEKIGNAMKVLSIDIPKAEVVLRVEKNRAVPCICEVTIRPKGHTIHVEEHEEDMYAAIDVAAAKVLRQLRKYKTRVIDYRMRETLKVDQVIEPTGQRDVSPHRRRLWPVEAEGRITCHPTLGGGRPLEFAPGAFRFILQETARSAHPNARLSSTHGKTVRKTPVRRTGKKTY